MAGALKAALNFSHISNIMASPKAGGNNFFLVAQCMASPMFSCKSRK